MRRSKTVYSYNQKKRFIGTETAWETWDLAEPPIWLIPNHCTEIPPPSIDPKTQIVVFDELKKSWIIQELPTPDNTPKPNYNTNTHDVFWNKEIETWGLLELNTPENTPKPTLAPNQAKEDYVIVWDTDRREWKIIRSINWNYIREVRNNLLKDSDWTMLSDVNLSNKDSWIKYRQELRNITQKFLEPSDIVWPTRPE